MGQGWDRGFVGIGESREFNQDMLRTLAMWAESTERLQTTTCHNVGRETGALDLEGWGERRMSTTSLLASLARVACGFPGSTCLSWGL